MVLGLRHAEQSDPQLNPNPNLNPSPYHTKKECSQNSRKNNKRMLRHIPTQRSIKNFFTRIPRTHAHNTSPQQHSQHPPTTRSAVIPNSTIVPHCGGVNDPRTKTS
eukprot:1319346-Amorphochlora_amoeboformis.AAC.1